LALGKWLWKALINAYADWIKIIRARIFRRRLERLDGKPIMGSSVF